ncbi:MFS transporter [Methanoplanus sp. FWC-SCC4]|uniref:MFS transporter n=1 Tax=Methanochimaera problematica TaxID=2609417 RepID=A0AA97I4L2_9EURY|nr:MFS transporter [Methanoplanus sp. FWC-SCC4]
MMSESMLVAALPNIEHEFAASGIFVAWILPVVLLVGAALSPFFGTLGDAFGRKWVLAICLLFYVAGVMFAGFAWDIWSLLVFRAMQGIGIAASPIAYALVSEQFPVHKIPFGISVLAASYGAGTFAGIFIGSYIINYLGWRWTYYLLTPVVIAHLLAIILMVRPSVHTFKKEIDWKGAFALLMTMFFLMLAMSVVYEDGIWSYNSAIPVILCIIAGYIFVKTEKTAIMPAIDIAMLKKPVIILISLTAFIVNCATFMLIQAMPFVVQAPTGLFMEERFVGLIMIPGSIADMIASPLCGAWMRRRSAKIPLYTGSLMMVAAPLCFILFPLSLSLLAVVWMLFSGGMGIVATAYMIITINSVPSERTAGATGLLHSGINIGGMLGPIIAGIFLAAYSFETYIAGELWVVPESTAYNLIFGLGLLMAVAVFVLVLMIIRQISANSKTTKELSGI